MAQHPLMRPDRGRPTHYGWWAPVALCYKKRVGVGTLGTRFTVPPQTHWQKPSWSRSRNKRREDPLPPRLLHTPPSFWASAGGGPKDAATNDRRRLCLKPSPPVSTPSLPSTWREPTPPPDPPPRRPSPLRWPLPPPPPCRCTPILVNPKPLSLRSSTAI